MRRCYELTILCVLVTTFVFQNARAIKELSSKLDVPDLLLQMPSLEAVSVGGASIELQRLQSTSVDFRNMHLDDTDAALLVCMAKHRRQHIADVGIHFRRQPITALDVSENKFGAHGVQAIASLIKTNPALRSLNISGNNLVRAC
jgi:hypothetical protein